jgi:hypothetical protein
VRIQPVFGDNWLRSEAGLGRRRLQCSSISLGSLVGVRHNPTTQEKETVMFGDDVIISKNLHYCEEDTSAASGNHHMCGNINFAELGDRS